MKVVYFLLFITLPILQDGWSSKLEKKISNTIQKTFSIESYQLTDIAIEKDLENETLSTINDHLYQITGSNERLGYIYVSQAESLKNVYDYAIILDRNLKIINTKVLIYRENHGRQIGAKRWLSQFIGLGSEDTPVLYENIDGISGATISSKSMTKAVNAFLKSLKVLIDHDVLER